MAASLAAVGLPGLPAAALPAAAAPALPARIKSCIWLWMSGGPSQKETFDPKPNSKDAGNYKPIQTDVPGIQLCELMPNMAKLMRHAAVIRNLQSPIPEHTQGTIYSHMGYPKGEGGLVYPAIGSVVSSQIAKPKFGLPKTVVVGQATRVSAILTGGFLGAAHAPLVLKTVTKESKNVMEFRTTPEQMDRRRQLFEAAESGFNTAHQTTDHLASMRRAVEFMNAKELEVFDLSRETDATRNAYGYDQVDGRAAFEAGQNCLLARRLVEVGVPFVEVVFGGWDHHGMIADSIKATLPPADRVAATLINDLKERGLLDSTLVVLAGEMGRSPSIRMTSGYFMGRSHWHQLTPAMVVGGGIPGGQVIGKSDDQGALPVGDRYDYSQLLATVYHRFGIDHHKDHDVLPGGRAVSILKKNVKPIAELTS